MSNSASHVTFKSALEVNVMIPYVLKLISFISSVPPSKHAWGLGGSIGGAGGEYANDFESPPTTPS